MSLLIKGMDMPKCCYDCFALDDNGDYDMCGITSRSQGYRFDSRNNKMKDCPLSEIPTPHGRLIDAEKLLRALDALKYMATVEGGRPTFSEALEEIVKAPTIIEAED